MSVTPPVKKDGMVHIAAARFLMGSHDFYPEEAPVHEAAVYEFWIDACAVTNREYARFVDETGYVTVAERALTADDFEGAEGTPAGSMVFRKTSGPVDLRDWRQWWDYVPGAYWRWPDGPGSSVDACQDHPVVHVAYEDAQAYAVWAHKRLPTEAEWEYAARGGLVGKPFVWGDELYPGGVPAANTWHGEFPWKNDALNGYEGTAPVGTFPPNGYGLYDMAGNVWEWTSDWYTATHETIETPCCAGSTVRTPEGSYDSHFPSIRIPRKVLKGGSFLCAPNYCLRFRPAARSPQMIDTGMSHVGFRCVLSAIKENAGP